MQSERIIKSNPPRLTQRLQVGTGLRCCCCFCWSTLQIVPVNEWPKGLQKQPLARGRPCGNCTPLYGDRSSRNLAHHSQLESGKRLALTGSKLLRLGWAFGEEFCLQGITRRCIVRSFMLSIVCVQNGGEMVQNRFVAELPDDCSIFFILNCDGSLSSVANLLQKVSTSKK